MADDITSTPAAAPASVTSSPVAPTPPASVAPAPLSLVEFCTRLSATDKRVEMVSAFASVQSAAGTGMALESVFLARYEDFCNAPA